MTQDKSDKILHTIVQRLVRRLRTLSTSPTNSQYVPYVLKTMLMLLMMVVGTSQMWGQTNITSLSQITATDGHYVITQDITGGTPGVSTFSGTLEANIDPTTKMPYRIKNLSAPLFTTLTGTVKNLVFEDVAITSGDSNGNTGAIACNMTGTSSNKAVIYNCGILSGSVSGDGNVGGLVGQLGQGMPASTTAQKNNCYARVINCYSFADIEGGSVRAGIVGYNSYSSKYSDQRTMVMNCMFYGNISIGGIISPIYGGSEISNSTSNRLNNYNYFLYESSYSVNKNVTSYNCALAAEERFLVRFEFYRHLLNSTRELAAWYATGDPANGKGIGSANQMAKWVLDKSIAPYPILKVQETYPSVVNYDAENVESIDSKNEHRNEGRKLTQMGTNGQLTITISTSKSKGKQDWPSGASITIANNSLTRNITDKDPTNYNFNYGKVQLPYYNEVGVGNYTENKVVTGWMITGFTNGIQGSRVAADFTTSTNYDYPNYNFADRDTYAKDLYTVSGRVFAQGAYFNVPTGVTGITIEPYWGKCVYLSDACYDRYGYNSDDNLTQVGGQRYTNNTNCPVLEGEQIVYTRISKKDNNDTGTYALDALTGVSNPTVYDYAVVLVGNYHKGDGAELVNNNSKPLTIMSIDLNKDNEPDYCFIFKSSKNQSVSHIRYDFITVPAMAMAHKIATSTDLAIPGNCCPQGWFEITTTGLIKFGQFEHSHQNKTLSPLILMGGVIDQFVANNTNEGANAPARTKYMHFGDNVWFKMFNNGCHMDKFIAPPRRPISITGGDYETFYLSGFFRPDAKPSEENAECYIDGGRFGEVAGAGQEQIDGNVTWLINHADIKNFYGGGINAAKPITGDITTTIENSHVDYFCGGPQFGNMQEAGTITLTWATNKAGTTTSSRDKTIDLARIVSTTAENCTFGTYFGAGFGGTSIFREQFYNEFKSLNYNEWNTKVNGTYNDGARGIYTEGKGVAYDYEYEFFGGSSGNVHRLYLLYASFSMAKTNNVSSTLTGCTVLGNFYGGGSLGAVSGNATSSLTDCIVKGNVFGAGYSVTKPKVKVRDTGGFTTEPNYNTSTGVYEEGVKPGFIEYVWDQQSINNGDNALVDGNHTIKTSEDLTGLGSVSGAVTLTITTTANGKSIIGTENDDNTGNVYGGGDQSSVSKAKISDVASTTVNLQGNTQVLGNVYGGGNQGLVEGSTEVNIEN